MPRNKVLEKAKVTAPSGRNPFDRSQSIACHSLLGELNCVMAQPVIAGTKGKISRRCFSRTASVTVPSFHNVTEHFDFFMVPIHSLWRQWNDWKVNINDMKDTNLVPWNATINEPNLNLPNNCPRLDFLDLIHTCLNVGNSSSVSVVRQANDMIKLSEAFGYGEVVATPADTALTARVMNTFIPAAYQKCYFEHYRNTAYESNNPYAYNFDWLYNGVDQGLFDLTVQQHRIIAAELFKMRRVNYRNDYFHNIYPALNYVLSQPNGRSFSVPSSVGGFSVAAYDPQSQSVSQIVSNGTANGGTTFIGSPYDLAQNLSFTSVQSIRAAFALDKLMRASAYAPKHVRDQWKVLYGVDTVDDPDMRSVRIGSFQSDVIFQEVTSMADTGIASPQGALGGLGAKGLGGEQKDKFINFFAKEDSIIIGLHYYLPRAMYDAYGLHPFNIKIARESFFNRFFENLGLRPFYYTYLDGTGKRANGNYSNSSIMIGWTVPNMELKIAPDLNYGAFKERFYTIRRSTSGGTPTVTVSDNATSVLSCYVPHNNFLRSLATPSAPITAEYFKVAPEDMDNLFVESVPEDHRVEFFQFYGAYRIAFVVVAGMSVHGQPML